MMLGALVLTGLCTGCGYMVGGNFQPDVRTVHVPVFQSFSNRRGLEYQLTEAVQKQIKTRTPFRLAKEPHAQTRLTGRIIEMKKNVLGETPQDDPRQLQLRLAVEVTWEDLQTGQILAQQQIPLAPSIRQLVSQSEFAPEVGQSLATGTQQAVDDLATQIVDLMEVPW
jgi:hypothetical protein